MRFVLQKEEFFFGARKGKDRNLNTIVEQNNHNRILTVQGRLPIKLLGIDSDNGSEFINTHLFRYCETHGIKFTRGRPNRRNDNCFIEQKNYSVIKRNEGYYRYDTNEEVAVLNELYVLARLQNNFFLPSMKLKEKAYDGSKVTKKHAIAKTPYQCLPGIVSMTEDAKKRMGNDFDRLNPVVIHRKIADLQEQLERIVVRKRRARLHRVAGEVKKQSVSNTSGDRKIKNSESVKG